MHVCVRRLGFVLYLVAGAVLSTASPAAPTATVGAPDGSGDTEISLATGDTRELSFIEGAEVRVTRRGVVDVLPTGETTWQLTALRGGFVIVEATDAETGKTLRPRYLVTVTGAAERRDGVLPGWVCAESGIRCETKGETGLVVDGVAPDWNWYARAFSLCAREDSCLFSARLSDRAAAAAQALVAAQLGPAYQSRWLPDGRLLIAAPCEDGRPVNSAEARLGDAAKNGLVLWRCHADAPDSAYRLSARLFLVEDHTARRLGLAPSFAGQVAVPARGAGAAAYRGSLAALEQERGVEAVGRPVVRLLPDHPVDLASGGEFQTVEVVASGGSSNDSLRTAWKQYGLTLKVRATPLTGDGVRLRLEGALKTRAGGETTTLTVSSVATSFDLPQGTPVLAACLDLASAARQSEKVPFLGDLPLVGPLFRLTGQDGSHARLLVWLEVSRDDDVAPAALPPPFETPVP